MQCSWIRSARAWLAATGLGLILTATAGAQAPKAGPTAPAKSARLAKYLPDGRVALFVEFDGLEAHDAAWKKSALYRLLNETRLGLTVEDLLTQSIDNALASGPKGEKPTSAEIIKALRGMAVDGFALAVLASDDPGPPNAVFVVRGAEKSGLRALVEKLEAAGPARSRPEKRGSRTIHVDNQPGAVSWFLEGDGLVACSNSILPAVIELADGRGEAATGHPILAELARDATGFETVLTAFVDVSKLPPMPPWAVEGGLDGLKRLDFRWGFGDEATCGVIGVVAPAPRRGYLSVFDADVFPPMEKGSLPPVPAGVNDWTAASFSPGKLWAWMTDIARKAAANGQQPAILQFEQGVSQMLGGLRVQEDILAPLGPKWLFHADLEKLFAGQKGAAALSVELNDPAAAAKAAERIVGLARQVIDARAAQFAQATKVEIRKLDGATPAYRIVLPPGMMPPQYASLVDPTIVIGKSLLAVGLSETDARAAASGEGSRPAPEFAAALAKAPARPFVLSMGDPRESFARLIGSAPGLLGAINMSAMAQARPGQKPFTLKIDPARYPTAAEVRARLAPGTSALTLDDKGLKIITRESLPSLGSPVGAPVLAALLLPAVQSSREAARRSQCVNNEKQIGLALHNYHSTNDHFPAAAVRGKDGKPLLSWRVAILPYIEQNALYNEFHLDEPWDSEHNKALIPRMPSTYLCPSRSNPEPGTTTYLGFSGDGSLFGPEAVGIRDVTDGTSNTIAVTESSKAVIWTKPEDIPFDLQAPPSLFGAGSDHPGGFNALIADGSVRFFKITINKNVFKALISRAGGEVVSADSF